jgi:hypothetical protein
MHSSLGQQIVLTRPREAIERAIERAPFSDQPLPTKQHTVVTIGPSRRQGERDASRIDHLVRRSHCGLLRNSTLNRDSERVF